MSEEKKAGREGKSSSYADPSILKELKEMLKRGDVDCTQMMSRMREMCCGAPEQSGEREEPVEEKKA